jgi:O-antigen/teichoic acid export membrane protein
MAGADKTASVPVFVMIGVIYTLDGLFGICGAGLLLHKRSRTVLALTLGSALLNVALNLVWIPRFGVMGAVYATAASFVALNVGRYLTCPRELRALPDARASVTALALGALSVLIAHYSALAGIESHALRFMLMALLMLFVFVLPAFLIDRPLREAATRHLFGRQTAFD